MSESYETQLNNWVNKEKLGVNLLNSVGTLMYDKGIELILFRNQLLEIGVSVIWYQTPLLCDGDSIVVGSSLIYSIKIFC